jgi:hypothetical protein
MKAMNAGGTTPGAHRFQPAMPQGWPAAGFRLAGEFLAGF